MMSDRKLNNGAHGYPQRRGLIRRGLDAPKHLLCFLASASYPRTSHLRHNYFSDASPNRRIHSRIVYSRDESTGSPISFSSNRNLGQPRILHRGPAQAGCQLTQAGPRISRRGTDGNSNSVSVFVVVSEGALSCMGMYRLESRAHGKSNDRNRRALTELSLAHCLARLRRLSGRKTRPQLSPPSLVQQNEPAPAGSQVRLTRRHALQRRYGLRSSRHGSEFKNTQRGVWYGSQGPQRIVIGRSRIPAEASSGTVELSSRLVSFPSAHIERAVG